MLVPGFTLTVAMTELATRNLVSGTARLAGAAGTFLAIGFGVALGTRVGVALFGAATALATRTALPLWTEGVALAIAPLALTVLLRAPCRDAPWIVVAGVLGLRRRPHRARCCSVRSWARSWAPSWWRAPATLLARAEPPVRHPHRPRRCCCWCPGSLGFQSLSRLLDRETVPGVEAAFRMTLVAVSLAMGLLFGQLVVPGRDRGPAPAR